MKPSIIQRVRDLVTTDSVWRGVSIVVITAAVGAIVIGAAILATKVIV